MSLSQRKADLPDQMHDSSWRECSFQPQQINQCDAVDVLHGVVEDARRRVPVIINLNCVRMRKLTGMLHFPLKPAERFRVRLVRVQNLHSCRSFQESVASKIHRAHPALADQMIERVRPQLLLVHRLSFFDFLLQFGNPPRGHR